MPVLTPPGQGIRIYETQTVALALMALVDVDRLHSLRLHLYRVNFEVNDLKPFPYLAFPHSKGPKTPPKLPNFDGELMASFSDLARPQSANWILF
jgi:hypothetical protein